MLPVRRMTAAAPSLSSDTAAKAPSERKTRAAVSASVPGQSRVINPGLLREVVHDRLVKILLVWKMPKHGALSHACAFGYSPYVSSDHSHVGDSCAMSLPAEMMRSRV